MNKNWWTVICIGLLFVLDRISKLIFFNGINNVDFGFFAFHFIKNTGASFGILKDMNLMLIGVAILAFGILMYYRKEVPKLSFILIMGGIFGNLVDRVFLGYVIDFIDFKFFPVFNLADSMITVGVAYWVILAIFKKDASK